MHVSMIAISAGAPLSRQPLLLDFQATTPCAESVVEAMAPYWSDAWGNPSSRQHRLGLHASAAVNLARRQLAENLGVAAERLVFTSGATEANNLALLGHARHWGSGHLISVATEHHAVLDPLAQLQREGFAITLLQPGADGLIDPAQLQAAITPDTRLVSVMAANNEIGVLQPLAELGAICRRHGITFHSDAAQAFGHMPLQPDQLGLDLVSLSAHKLYGPKGIGALVMREGLALQPLQWGGGQEAGLRAGTLPTALIVGFATAAQLAMADRGGAATKAGTTAGSALGSPAGAHSRSAAQRSQTTAPEPQPEHHHSRGEWRSTAPVPPASAGLQQRLGLQPWSPIPRAAGHRAQPR